MPQNNGGRHGRFKEKQNDETHSKHITLAQAVRTGIHDDGQL
ncbi:MAG: hypothetical protein JWO03_220 [Bacteroidetes bacterium]|nr:hypothetical protein [Bacteroidota bacterium]